MTFYSTALLLTLVAELPLVFFLMGGRRRGAILAHAFLLNLFTHPLVYFAIQTDLVSFTTGEIALPIGVPSPVVKTTTVAPAATTPGRDS